MYIITINKMPSFINPQNEVLTPCLLSKCSPEIRQKLKESYKSLKKYGIRAGFGIISGAGMISLIKEAVADGVIRHGKRRIGCILVTSGLSLCSSGIVILSNTTKVLKYSKACHSVCAACWRSAHNIAEVPLILVDFAVFGEYIPSCGEIDYDLFSDTTDIMVEFLGE